jgi:uncharacterized membrane protein
MRHVFFALFDRSEPAAEALRELRQIKREYPRAPMEVSVQRGNVDGEKLPLYATNGRRRLIFGVVNGLFWGALVGILLFVSGIASASLGILLAFTAMMGAVIGGLGGMLMGVSAPDEALEHLAGHLNGNDVSISFSTSDDDLFTRAQDVFVGNGARVEKRVAV